MYWVAGLLALAGAIYRVATTRTEASWWLLIAVLGALTLADMYREWRAYRAAKRMDWVAENSEQGEANED